MNTVQSTIYGAKLRLHLLTNQVPDIPPKTTANERLDILGTARPGEGEPLKLGVLMAGNRGHAMSIGNEGIPLTSIVDHMANHASLFNPMPWCMREVNDDLPQAMRLKYCLRKEETHNGKNWYVYYGLRIKVDKDNATVKMKVITTENGQTLETDFTPTTADLFPEPQVLPNKGAVTTSDVRLAASAIVSVRLNEVDIAEYVNVAKQLYGGDERYAIQSEYALCTGFDRMQTVPSTSGDVNFLESIATQVYSFAADYKALYYNAQELDLDFDLGNQVPLLATASIPTLETIGTST